MPHTATRKQNAYRELSKTKTSVAHPRISIETDHVSVTAIQMTQRGCVSRREKMRAKLWEHARPVTWVLITPLAFIELIFVLRLVWEFTTSIWRFAGSFFA